MNQGNKVWITYEIFGWEDSDAAKDERKFRVSLLGDNHWSAISYSAQHRSITLRVTEEQALLFKLKFPSCSIDRLT